MTQPPQPEFLQPPVRIDGPITLADADPGWAAQYARQEERIRAALGSRAVQIEHVGSTSVPGLAAKPIIDILLLVVDSADEAAYLPDLEAAAYQLQFREPEWYEHRFLRDFGVQVHVFSVGAAEVERMLLFRDVLRNRSDERELLSAPSVSLPPDAGRTSRTMPTPSPPLLRRSSSGLEPVEALTG